MEKALKAQNKEFDRTSLFAEYSQAWEHYRHLENARTKYMNFFFTALFAIIGLYSTLLNLKSIEIGELQVILGIILLQLFILFTIFIFINVTRIGRVLKGYQGVKGKLREMLFEKTGVPEGISVHDYLPEPPKVRIFSVQTSSRTMLILTILFANAFSMVSFTSILDSIYNPYKVILLVLFIVVLLIEIIVFFRVFKKKEK